MREKLRNSGGEEGPQRVQPGLGVTRAGRTQAGDLGGAVRAGQGALFAPSWKGTGAASLTVLPFGTVQHAESGHDWLDTTHWVLVVEGTVEWSPPRAPLLHLPPDARGVHTAPETECWPGPRTLVVSTCFSGISAAPVVNSGFLPGGHWLSHGCR